MLTEGWRERSLRMQTQAAAGRTHGLISDAAANPLTLALYRTALFARGVRPVLGRGEFEKNRLPESRVGSKSKM